jgi:2,5-diamino-6-(ribosylamino)-4(3H)-pyrimidinone 5'-phosphate reductase
LVKIYYMNRPRIIVNVAATADGKIDSILRKGASISSVEDKARVDRLRAGVDAILVGGRTLLNEDPKLTVKSAGLRAERLNNGRPEYPAKVGIITRIPDGLKDRSPFGDGVYKQSGLTYAPLQQFFTSGSGQIYLFTTRCTDPETLVHLESAGATVQTLGQERVDLVAVLRSLHKEGIKSILVEGGGTLIAELFRLDLVDELTIYIAPMIFGGASAPSLADGPGFLPDHAPRLKFHSVKEFDGEGGILIHYLVEHKE